MWRISESSCGVQLLWARVSEVSSTNVAESLSVQGDIQSPECELRASTAIVNTHLHCVLPARADVRPLRASHLLAAKYISQCGDHPTNGVTGLKLKRVRRAFAVLATTAVVFTLSVAAQAELGGSEASVQTDQQRLRGALRVQRVQNYAVHELRTENN